jgi:FAD/FMN-containing dehydrogenase
MSEIFIRHRVNVINVSVRHAKADSGSLMAWAREEVFAFVVYYKQKTDEIEKGRVAVWTRELIDAALSLQGSYYLPYQPHATIAQLHKAYPKAKELFALKQQFDPSGKFRNVIWDTYYKTG